MYREPNSLIPYTKNLFTQSRLGLRFEGNPLKGICRGHRAPNSLIPYTKNLRLKAQTMRGGVAMDPEKRMRMLDVGQILV